MSASGSHRGLLRSRQPEGVWRLTSATAVVSFNALLCMPLLAVAVDWNQIALQMDPSGIVLQSWMAGQPCGGTKFKGVTCEGGVATAIDLANLGLSGSMTPELGQITTLTRLNLQGNFFYGNIPQTFNTLVNLKDLIACCNVLDGSLPDLGALTNLQTLDLSHNNLQNGIPEGMGKMGMLTALALNDNHLIGSLPASFGNLKRLQSLSVNGNQLQGSIPAGLNYLATTPGAFYNFSSNGFGFCGSGGFKGVARCPGLPKDLAPAPAASIGPDEIPPSSPVPVAEPPTPSESSSPPSDPTSSPSGGTPPKEPSAGNASPNTPGTPTSIPSNSSTGNGTKTAPPPPPPNETSSKSSSGSSSGMSTTVIIAAAAGGAAVLGVLLFVIFCCYCRKSKKTAEAAKTAAEVSPLVAGAAGKGSKKAPLTKSISGKKTEDVNKAGDIEAGWIGGEPPLVMPAIVIATSPEKRTESKKAEEGRIQSNKSLSKQASVSTKQNSMTKQQSSNSKPVISEIESADNTAAPPPPPSSSTAWWSSSKAPTPAANAPSAAAGGESEQPSAAAAVGVVGAVGAAAAAVSVAAAMAGKEEEKQSMKSESKKNAAAAASPLPSDSFDSKSTTSEDFSKKNGSLTNESKPAVNIPPVVPLPALKSLPSSASAAANQTAAKPQPTDTDSTSLMASSTFSETAKPSGLAAYGAAGRTLRAADMDHMDDASTAVTDADGDVDDDASSDGLSQLGLNLKSSNHEAVPGAGWAHAYGSASSAAVGYEGAPSEMSDDAAMGGGIERFFTVAELALATNDFGRQGARNVLGSGRYGTVYKARLPDGTTVAVKRLSNRNHDQSAREFKFEVEAMSHARHPNLVALLGCCAENEERMLVYEYLPNGSLESWLHHNNQSEPLDWQMRMHVAIGCARGLTQLHEGLEVKVVHRDVKSSNVLLDAQWNAKIGDFALAKIMGKDQGHATTRVVGTFGCAAPEYMNTGILTERSDVYSFGVMLLELVSGRKPVDNQLPPEEVDLVRWVKRMQFEERLADVVDPRLQGMVPIDDAEYVLGVAMKCVETNALKRPRISQVVNMLESEDPTQKGDWVARRPSPLSARPFRDASPRSTPFSRTPFSQASPRASIARTDSYRSSSPRHSSGMSPHAPDVGAMITSAALRASSPRHFSPTAPRNASPTGMPTGGARPGGSMRPSSPRSASPTAGDYSTGAVIASHAMSIGSQRRLGSWNRR